MSKWPMVRLGDVCEFVNGGTPSKKVQQFYSGTIPWITSADIVSDEVKNARCFITEEAINNSTTKLVKKGTILLVTRTGVGKVAITGMDLCFSQDITGVLPDISKLNKKYLAYFLKSNINYFVYLQRGATIQGITRNVVESLEITLSPLNIQKHIADTLDKTQEIINGHKKQLAELDNLIKAIFHEMFGDPITNERSWSLLQLNKLGELGRGVSKHRPRNAPELLGGIYPFIQTGDVANSDLYISEFTQTYNELGLSQSKMWHEGTLCITIAANIAKTAILGFDACFPDSVVGFCANENSNNIFIHYWFGFFQAILEAQAPESAQKNINLRILNELKVINPPPGLQTEFAEIVTKIEEQKAIVKQAITESENLFNSLMSEYFG